MRRGTLSAGGERAALCARAMVRVAVRSLAAELLELDAEPEADVEWLRASIAEAWRVPPVFQRLLLADAALDDPREKLASLCEGPAPLQLAMLVSSDEACRGLETREEGEIAAQKIRILEAFAQLGRRGACERAVAAVVWQLADDDDCVQNAAVQALSAMVARGDEFATARVRLLVEMIPTRYVHYAAANALAMVSRRGDQGAIAVVTALLREGSEDVRYAAVKAMAWLLECDDERGVAEVIDRLEDTDSDVRYAAAKTLAQVSARGNRRVIVALSRRHVSDVCRSVRQAALEALGELRLERWRRCWSHRLRRMLRGPGKRASMLARDRRR